MCITIIFIIFQNFISQHQCVYSSYSSLSFLCYYLGEFSKTLRNYKFATTSLILINLLLDSAVTP